MRRRISTRPIIVAVVAFIVTTILGAPVSAQSFGSFDTYQGMSRRLAEASTPFLFSVYPEGGNGEVGYVAASNDDRILASLNQLRGEQPFNVYLFTAWSWHNQEDLDGKIARYAAEGFHVTLSIKYSPPQGREGDIAGYEQFVRGVVSRYSADVHRFVIGNEANVTWGNPGSSDGPFARSDEAIVRGVLAARQVIAAARSGSEVGFNIAITGRDYDAGWVQGLAEIGGDSFIRSVAFMGLNVYPGLWPVGTGDAYADTRTYLADARYALTSAGFGRNVSINVLENGFPTADDAAQANRLGQMVQAVCEARYELGVSGYSWFGLLDADSSSEDPFAHYGLLRSDLSKRPAFDVYRTLVAEGCGG